MLDSVYNNCQIGGSWPVANPSDTQPNLLPLVSVETPSSSCPLPFYNQVLGDCAQLREYLPSRQLQLVASPQQWNKNEVRDANRNPEGGDRSNWGRLQRKEERWESLPGLSDLIAVLRRAGKDDPATLNYILKIIKRHGQETASKVAAELAKYYASASDKAEAATLIRDTLHDLAFPSAVVQNPKGTCAAAGLQMKLAIEDPLEYAKMLTTLAEEKPYRMKTGYTIQPNTTWRGDKSDTRSLSCKILQNAIMQLGNGSYDSRTDDGVNPGMGTGALESAGQKMFGKRFEWDHVGQWTLSHGTLDKDDLFGFVEDDVARGRPVVVAIKEHCIIVVGIDKSKQPPTVIVDSYGKQFEMTVDEFKKVLLSVFSYDDPGIYSNNHKTPNGKRTVVGDG